MAIRVYGSDGEGFVLLNEQDREVGWVRGRSLGCRGFASEEDTLRAAIVAHDALERWTARQRGMRPDPRSGTALLRVGRADSITLGRETIGRLHRPGEGAVADDSFALEIQLPPRTSEGAAITAAVAVHHAIERWRETTERDEAEQLAGV